MGLMAKIETWAANIFARAAVDPWEGFWSEEFSELAEFNSEDDKSKYSEDYLSKMRDLQKVYNEESKACWAKQGVIL